MNDLEEIERCTRWICHKNSELEKAQSDIILNLLKELRASRKVVETAKKLSCREGPGYWGTVAVVDSYGHEYLEDAIEKYDEVTNGEG